MLSLVRENEQLKASLEASESVNERYVKKIDTLKNQLDSNQAED